MLKPLYGRDRTRKEIRMSLDAETIFELLKILFRGQRRVTDVVRTWNRRGTDVIMRASAVIQTWKDAIGRESLAAYHGLSRSEHVHSTAVPRSFRVCSAANHGQADFAAFIALPKPVSTTS